MMTASTFPDFAPVGIITRLARARAHLDAGLQHVFDRYDCPPPTSSSSSRCAGPAHRTGCRSRSSCNGWDSTSGTVSVRIDRLVARRVVTREPDATDRRVQLIRLTEQGLHLFDEIAPVHLVNEDRLLSALDGDQREQLANLLRVLLVSFERPTVTITAFGLELLQAHTARARDTAVGLSDVPGLLVAAAPAAGSPADLAGLQRGDLITTIDGADARSCATLTHACAEASCAQRPLTISYLRKERHHRPPSGRYGQGERTGAVYGEGRHGGAMVLASGRSGSPWDGRP